MFCQKSIQIDETSYKSSRNQESASVLNEALNDFDVNYKKQKCKLGHHNSFAVSSGVDIRAPSNMRVEEQKHEKKLKIKTITRDVSKLQS